MFERAGHDTAGLGIGPTLARQLVALHEGTLKAASDGLGRGARFTVRLDLASPPESNAEPMHRPGLPARGLRFLIADDNREIAGCLATLVEEAGNVAHVVHDGAAAVAAAEIFRPDVVLLDLGMPIMGGVAACGALRALPRGPALVIVALTGWGQARDRDATRAAGFEAHSCEAGHRGRRTVAGCDAACGARECCYGGFSIEVRLVPLDGRSARPELSHWRTFVVIARSAQTRPVSC